VLEQIPVWVYEMFKLYRRCKDFDSLPDIGGINDQEEYTMQCLSIVHNAVTRYQKEQSDDELRSIEQRMRVASALRKG